MPSPQTRAQRLASRKLRQTLKARTTEMDAALGPYLLAALQVGETYKQLGEAKKQLDAAKRVYDAASLGLYAF